MAAVAGPLLSAGSSIMSGRAQARGYANEAAQAEIQAKGVDLQTLQTSERRREDFRASVASIEANRIARGLSLDSPSAIAAEKELRRQAVRDEGAEALGFRNQSDALRRSARAKRRGASNSIMASYMQAGSTLWDGAQGMASAGFGGSSSAGKMPATGKTFQKNRSSL